VAHSTGTRALGGPLGSLGRDRPLVCVQGLGFVGAAMALAVADARGPGGDPVYDVAGVELDNEHGRAKVEALNAGTLPFQTVDVKLPEALDRAREAKNFAATTDSAAFAHAEVVVVDVGVNLVRREGEPPTAELEPLVAAIRTLGETVEPGTLVMVETTVPPGTCERVLAPVLAAALEERGLPADAVLLAYSYERVMPGEGYLDSVINFWRVYAGSDDRAAEACDRFLSSVINVRDYPLTRLPSMTASETGKLLENSYRAVTIAFMEEWGRFAEEAGVDLFEVIAAIRMRPTHSNIREPGFGVGGYCLTKDPLFAEVGARELFERGDLDFQFSREAVRLNDAMPLVTLDRLAELFGGELEGKRILLLGVAYRQGVGDTRGSPAKVFSDEARARGAEVSWHDPMVDDWEGAELSPELPDASGFDAVVFAVQHREYTELDVVGWLGAARPLVIDAHHVLGRDQLSALARAGCRVWSIGRGWVRS
jgi:UDP-N-acetyl-D-glucosamine dehydrogenase